MSHETHSFLVSFCVTIGVAASGHAEIRSDARDIRALNRSIAIGFSYEETLSFLLAEDALLELLHDAESSPQRSGSIALREKINSVSSVTLVLDGQNTGRSCLSAFVTISSGSYLIEFGALVDVENLNDKRPIFVFDHQIICGESIHPEGVLKYRLNPISVRIEDSPRRFLIVNPATGEANLSGMESQ